MPRVHSRVSRAVRVLSEIVPAVAETFRLQRPGRAATWWRTSAIRRGCRNQGRRTRLASRASPGSPGTSRPGQPGTRLGVGPRVVPPGDRAHGETLDASRVPTWKPVEPPFPLHRGLRLA